MVREAEGGCRPVVVRVTPWRDGAPRAHRGLEERDADYRFELMEDPMRFFKVFK
jgi:hypothetical protein